MKVAIISPNVFSLYSSSVLSLFLRREISITGVVVKRLFNPKRFRNELHRNGKRFVRKIYRKLILRSAENSIGVGPNILAFMQENDIPRVSLRKICKDRRIPLLFVDDLDNVSVTAFFQGDIPDCIAFTGGGIIGPGLIQASRFGVVNCHMGLLPEYRGMDVVQWAILNRDFSSVGLTTHLMDDGIDTGPIIDSSHLLIDDFYSLAQVRNAIEAKMPEFLVDSCIQLVRTNGAVAHQKIEDGIQYFRMHERLHQEVDTLLRNNFLEKID